MSINRASRNKQWQADNEAMGRLDTSAAVEAFGHDVAKFGLKEQTKRTGVLVYLDIDPTVSWHFRAQPGAIRRVVMNLIGNSLKFTTSGYIWISLRQVEQPGRKGKQQSKVVLTVSDSGKGIGDEYLHNDLFSPFKQEDPLAPGTGLGLSLVRQISTTMGGSVTVTSQLGRGTTVRVSLPLGRPTQPVFDDSTHQDLLKRVRGLSLSLAGFDSYHDRVIEETPEQPAQVSEAAVMETLCRDWLGLRIIPASAAELEGPDLFLYKEAAFTDLDGRAISERLGIPAVVICRDALTAHTFAKSAEKSWTTEFISQPVGPRRLARSLALAVLKWKERIQPATTPQRRGSTTSTNNVMTSDGEMSPQQLQLCHCRAVASSSRAIRKEKAAMRAGDFRPIGGPDSPPKSPPWGAVAKHARNISQESGAIMRLSSPANNCTGVSANPDKRKYLLVDDNDINLRVSSPRRFAGCMMGRLTGLRSLPLS